jgi:hypothetical protein
LLVLAFSVTVLIGWMFHLAALKSIFSAILLTLGVGLSLTLVLLELVFRSADAGEQKQAEEKFKASLREISDLKTALDEHAIVAITAREPGPNRGSR